ncbi:MAG TPA: M1 family aminopeptidase, partial [Pyrinomonadaceae bacterium]|nr:M1 family aminopeptidase [Pyrinomonadaceae bacterium]
IVFILHSPSALAQKLSTKEAIVRYALNVQVRAADKRIEVEGTMRIPAVKLPRAFIELSLSELMRDLRVEVLRPNANASAVNVETTRTEAGFSTPGGVTNQDIFYRVQPSKPFAKGEDIELKFSCSSVEKMGLMFYVGPEVTFASAYGTPWYPQVSEHSRGIGSLKISVPVGEKAIASGERRSSIDEEAHGTFRFENNYPTYLSFAAGKYIVTRREGAIPVSAFLLRSRPNMPEYLEGIQKILKVLVAEFGRYQYKEFALVEVPRELARKSGFNAATPQGFAYINSNAFNVSPSALHVLLEWYGHEFSHEWWPHVVSIKRPGGRFIEESLAEYGGLRAVETLAGPVAAEQYRRNGYEPDPIYSASAYFKLVNEGIDGPLSDLPADEKFRNVAYNKGFLVWDMLSREIGRRKFQHILRNITRRYAFQRLTIKELWQAIEANAGRDLSWFYKQWFERMGAPDFHLTWKQKGTVVHGTITQMAPYYRATLEVEFAGDDEQRFSRSLSVNGPQTRFALTAKFRVSSVNLDPHYLVLRWTPEYRNVGLR